MRKILGLLLVIGLTLAVVAEEKPKEIVEEKKEKITLKGWGSKFFDALDGEVDKTKEYQKKQWEQMKKKFGKLFNKDDEKEWEEIDKTMEEKDDI